ncbi:MAG: hypothetical protein Q9227_003012 [Pyrenula ochraceoflavens]
MASRNTNAGKGSKIAKSSKSPSNKASKSSAGRSKASPARPAKQVKTKPAIQKGKAKARDNKSYTDKELGLPALNMITPAGVQKPRGKKKGKVFVDEQESMKTILAIVQAEKEGQIESKMIKARQLEEIRQARQKEAEARELDRKARMEETKKSIKQAHNRRNKSSQPNQRPATSQASTQKTKKRVSFE